jgi:hypothetical protein
MTDELVCWKCGASLAELPLPFGRLYECPACRAYLHACKMCVFYDVNATKQCREDDAEEVIEKERANFCEYFKARPNAYQSKAHGKAQAARSRVDALFTGSDVAAESPADEAKKKLNELFGGKKQ